VLGTPDADLEDVGGVGGTLAGNALSLAAPRATLEHVLTDGAFEHMIGLAERHEEAVREVIGSRELPWHVVRLGARAEYRFRPEPPRTGGEAAAASDSDLDAYMHLYLMNRGVLITPFHNMALMCPATTVEDVDRHAEVFADAADELVAA
jgi:glutamate-1-semialdehyde 2,1-aminomutase